MMIEKNVKENKKVGMKCTTKKIGRATNINVCLHMVRSKKERGKINGTRLFFSMFIHSFLAAFFS